MLCAGSTSRYFCFLGSTISTTHFNSQVFIDNIDVGAAVKKDN
jgi:hypothetical protein